MNRETLKKRINALLGRTTGRGFTEAEAMEAAAKAAELMKEHQLSSEELEMTEAEAPTRSPARSIKARLWGVIASCTNSAALITESVERGRLVIYCGREPGPEIAVYLFAVCENAIKHEAAKFRAGVFYRRRRSAATRKAAVDDFTTGLVWRLEGRLKELFASSRSTEAIEQAQAYRDRRSPNAATVKSKAPKIRFDDAVNAGWKAGGQVNLSKGVKGSNSDPLMIGIRG